MHSFDQSSINTLLASIAAEDGTSADLLAMAQDRQHLRQFITSSRPVWVDCSVTPKIPEGYAYYEEDQLPNLFRGRFDFNRLDVRFCPTQLSDAFLVGKVMLSEHPSVLPSHIIDHIKADPSLFPDSWFSMLVVCGTIFRLVDTSSVRDHVEVENRYILGVTKRKNQIRTLICSLGDTYGGKALTAVPRQ